MLSKVRAYYSKSRSTSPTGPAPCTAVCVNECLNSTILCKPEQVHVLIKYQRRAPK